MQTGAPSSMARSSTALPLRLRLGPKRSNLHVQCTSRLDAAYLNINWSSSPAGRVRHEWLSACAILTSKIIAASKETDESMADFKRVPIHGAPLRVAYYGVPGAYTEAAAVKAYPTCESIPCDQFEVAFQAVELWMADRAVLPVENSLGGSIHRNYDLLLRHHLHIVGEVQIPVHHCLLALPGVQMDDVNCVISHPQALSQCENTLTQLRPSIAREAFSSTAAAAEYISTNNLRDTAAIASKRAAELYDLQILVDGIQDDMGNMTRFLILAREPMIPRIDVPYKTSIVFAHDNGTSVLFKVLTAFAFRNIGLTKIESRPHRKRPLRLENVGGGLGMAKHFEYMFYVDFEASLAEERAQNALAEVQEFSSFLRILGSYPMDMDVIRPEMTRGSEMNLAQ